MHSQLETYCFNLVHEVLTALTSWDGTSETLSTSQLLKCASTCLTLGHVCGSGMVVPETLARCQKECEATYNQCTATGKPPELSGVMVLCRKIADYRL